MDRGAGRATAGSRDESEVAPFREHIANVSGRTLQVLRSEAPELLHGER